MSLELARSASVYPITDSGTIADPLRSGCKNGRVLSLAEQFHIAHKARLARMGEPPRYQRSIMPANPPVIMARSAPYPPNALWETMWFWDLVTCAPKITITARPSIEKIIKAVCVHYNVTRADVMLPCRFKAIVLARQVIMYLAHRYTKLSYPQIGRHLGGRDHTTVLYGTRKIEHLIKISKEMRENIDVLTREILLP